MNEICAIYFQGELGNSVEGAIKFEKNETKADSFLNNTI